MCLSACVILCRSFFSCFFVDRFSFPVFLSCVFLPVSFYADLSSPASSWTALVSQSFSRVSFCLCHFTPIFLLLRCPLSFSVFFSCLSFCLCHLYADLSSPDSSRTAFLSQSFSLPVSFYAGRTALVLTLSPFPGAFLPPTRSLHTGSVNS